MELKNIKWEHHDFVRRKVLIEKDKRKYREEIFEKRMIAQAALNEMGACRIYKWHWHGFRNDEPKSETKLHSKYRIDFAYMGMSSKELSSNNNGKWKGAMYYSDLDLEKVKRIAKREIEDYFFSFLKPTARVAECSGAGLQSQKRWFKSISALNFLFNKVAL